MWIFALRSLKLRFNDRLLRSLFLQGYQPSMRAPSVNLHSQQSDDVFILTLNSLLMLQKFDLQRLGCHNVALRDDPINVSRYPSSSAQPLIRTPSKEKRCVTISPKASRNESVA